MSDSPLAAVDVGTNSVRLMIGEVRDGRVDQIERLMRITRLGAGVDASRRLDPAAVERTLAVLREFREVLDTHGSPPVRATATSAARDATNREDLFGPAADLGFELELLSGDDEAALSFLGATSGLDPATHPGPYLVVDIGGGSTEFVYGDAAPDSSVSLPMGCVRTTEQYLESDPPAPEELSVAVTAVRDDLAEVSRALPHIEKARTFVGLAGTITTVAAVELGQVEYDRDAIHHLELSRDQVEDVFRTLATETADERRLNPGLEEGRVDVIVGGTLVLATILRTFALDSVLVSEADILDGLVLSQAS